MVNKTVVLAFLGLGANLVAATDQTVTVTTTKTKTVTACASSCYSVVTSCTSTATLTVSTSSTQSETASKSASTGTYPTGSASSGSSYSGGTYTPPTASYSTYETGTASSATKTDTYQSIKSVTSSTATGTATSGVSSDSSQLPGTSTRDTTYKLATTTQARGTSTSSESATGSVSEGTTLTTLTTRGSTVTQTVTVSRSSGSQSYSSVPSGMELLLNLPRDTRLGLLEKLRLVIPPQCHGYRNGNVDRDYNRFFGSNLNWILHGIHRLLHGDVWHILWYFHRIFYRGFHRDSHTIFHRIFDSIHRTVVGCNFDGICFYSHQPIILRNRLNFKRSIIHSINNRKLFRIFVRKYQRLILRNLVKEQSASYVHHHQTHHYVFWHSLLLLISRLNRDHCLLIILWLIPSHSLIHPDRNRNNRLLRPPRHNSDPDVHIILRGFIHPHLHPPQLNRLCILWKLLFPVNFRLHNLRKFFISVKLRFHHRLLLLGINIPQHNNLHPPLYKHEHHNRRLRRTRDNIFHVDNHHLQHRERAVLASLQRNAHNRCFRCSRHHLFDHDDDQQHRHGEHAVFIAKQLQ
ncbi:hypothetical protein V8C26DRAFT_432220 [Trichoderma gracile]